MARIQFVICIQNKGYPVALEREKVYQMLADKAAGKRGLVRVVDESGEDHLYPRDYFLPIRLSETVVKALALAA